MKRVLLISIALSIPLAAQCQNIPDNYLGNWLMYFGNHKLSSTYSIHNEVQIRLYEPAGNFNQGFIRLGLNYHINENSLVTAGYGFFRTESFVKGESKTYANEHRIWQQFILRNKISRIDFEHRYRWNSVGFLFRMERMIIKIVFDTGYM